MAINNSKSAAELRIGTVKATVWENEVGGITRHNVTFSQIYPDGGQWKTTQSFRFSNLLSVAKLADQAHTLIGVESGRGRNPTLRVCPVPFDDVDDGAFADAEIAGDPTIALPAVDGMEHLRGEPV